MLQIPKVQGDVYSHSSNEWESIKSKLENVTKDHTPFMLMPVRLETRFMKVYRKEYLFSVSLDVKSLSEQFNQYGDYIKSATSNVLNTFDKTAKFTGEISKFVKKQENNISSLKQASSEEKSLINDDIKDIQETVNANISNLLRNNKFSSTEVKTLERSNGEILEQLEGLNNAFQSLPLNRETGKLTTPIFSSYYSANSFAGRTGIYKTVQRPELWVRIYPDDIFVHTHEEQLTEAEVNAGIAYWEEWWASNGDTEDQLGAWKAICEHYDPQRAAWIIKQTTPDNMPTPPSGGTVVFTAENFSAANSIFQNFLNSNTISSTSFVSTAQRMASTLSALRTELKSGTLTEEDQKATLEEAEGLKKAKEVYQKQLDAFRNRSVKHPIDRYLKDDPTAILNNMSSVLGRFKNLEDREGPESILSELDKQNNEFSKYLDQVEGEAPVNPDLIDDLGKKVAEVRGLADDTGKMLSWLEEGKVIENKTFDMMRERYGRYLRELQSVTGKTQDLSRRMSAHLIERRADIHAIGIQKNFEEIIRAYDTLFVEIDHLANDIGGHSIPQGWNIFNYISGTPNFETANGLITKGESWTQAAKTHVLPDHFVAVGLNVNIYDLEDGHKDEQYEFLQLETGKLVPSTLQLGPDPSAFSDDLYEQLSNGDLEIEENIQWMVDFNKAVANGMGIVMPLKEDFQPKDKIFDKLIVLGLKLDKSRFHTPSTGGSNYLEVHSQKLLEELLNNHHYTNEGLEFIEAGTPTNNTSQSSSGLKEDKLHYEDSFNYEVLGNAMSYTTNAYRHKKDGQRLAEALGIDFDVFNKIKNANLKQVSDGLKFNEVMWNATIGNFAQEMMSGLFTRDSIERLQVFFNEHVHARGILPSLRVGNQPYGILPTSSLTRWMHGFEDELDTILKSNLYSNAIANGNVYTSMDEEIREKRFQYRLKGLMDLLMQRWYNLHTQHVLHVGNLGSGTNTVQQDFMHMLGLEGVASDIFTQFPHISGYYLQAMDEFGNFPETFDWDQTTIHGFKGGIKEHILGGTYIPHSMVFGNNSHAKFMTYHEEMELFEDPTVDRKKVSKLLKVNNHDMNNYIRWFVDAPLSKVWDYGYISPGQPHIPSPAKEPLPLLFKLLRQSYLMAHLDAFTDTALKAGLLGDINIHNRLNNSTLYEIPNTVQISYPYLYYPGVVSTIKHEDSKWAYLFENTNNLFAAESPIVSSFMTSLQAYVNIYDLNLDLTNAKLGDQIKAFNSGFWQIGNGSTNRRKLRQMKFNLNAMRKWSTQKLDLHLREHLDLCSYRLDAWMSGIVNKRLFSQRNVSYNTRRKGIYLGAYGWLENVVVGGAREEVSQSNLPTEFQGLSGKIFTDDDNLGYIHTPSLNHALTAAILRSGYESNKMSQLTSANINNQLAVNLSSERIRIALHLWEGIKNGQRLSELLGFQFERNLLDRYGLDLHSEIYHLRKEFPLESVVDITNPDAPGDDETINHIVVNGIDLLGDLRANSIVINALDTDPSDSIYDILMANTSLFTSVLAFTSVPAYNDRKAIAREIDLMANSIDALGDLAIAEGVFQVSNGNYERSNATVDALSETANLQNPEFIKTPRTGINVQHKLVVNTSTSTSLPSGWTASTTKATLAPIWNNWLAKYLPSGNHIMCKVEYMNVTDNVFEEIKVTANELGLQAVDVYTLLINGEEALIKRIANYVRDTNVLGNDIELKISIHTRGSLADWTDDVHTFGDIMVLVDGLQSVSSKLRPVSKFDVMLTEDVDNSVTSGWNLSVLHARVDSSYDILDDLINDIGTEADINALPSSDIRDYLNDAIEFNLPHAVPYSAVDPTDPAEVIKETATLRKQLIAALAELELMRDQVETLFTEYASQSDDRVKHETLTKAVHKMFGVGVNLLPILNISDIPYGDTDFETGEETPVYGTYLPAYLNQTTNSLLANFNDDEKNRWMFGLARVQTKISDYEYIQSLGGCFNNSVDVSNLNLDVMQFPHYTGDLWYGCDMGSTYVPTGDKSSVIFTEKSQLGSSIVGFILEEWTEAIPVKEETTGLTFNYDQPNSKPAQNILLAVAPRETGTWEWDDLLFTLLDTLKMAKVRTVEPEHIAKDRAIAKYVPAIISMKEAKYSKLGDFEHFTRFTRNVITDFNNSRQ